MSALRLKPDLTEHHPMNTDQWTAKPVSLAAVETELSGCAPQQF
jgi:hypothetical protein